MSPESVYSRFFNLRSLDSECDRLLRANADDEFVLVAESRGAIVALAQFVRLADAAKAEAAFLVADSMQGRGVGTRLLEQLGTEARARGITAFHAWVLGTNHKMLQVFVDSGFTIRSRSDQGVLEVVLSLEETPLVHVQERPSAQVSPPEPRCARSSSRRRWPSSAPAASAAASAQRFSTTSARRGIAGV